MSSLFHIGVYQPIYNLLVFLYDAIPGGDFGIAIIVATILLKLALFPLSQKQIESQRKMQEIQPKIKELQKKHAGDREQQSRAMMEFYKENKINPLSGCLPLVLQLVVLIAIYRVLFNISHAGFVVSPEDLYSFVSNPGDIRRLFIGMLDLSKPSMLLAATTAVAQYYQMKMIMDRKKDEKNLQEKPKDTKKSDEAPDFNQIMTKQMLYIGPGLTLFFGITFPSGLALYWFVSTLFMIVQQHYLLAKDSASGTRIPKRGK